MRRRGRSSSARWPLREGARPRASRHGDEPQQPRLPAPGPGRLCGARPLFERALAIHEKALGPEHPDTAASLNNLAVLLRHEGDFAGARPLYERALAIHEKVLGPEHPETANSMSNLAPLLSDTGHANEAEPLFRRRSQSVRRRWAGPFTNPAVCEPLRAPAGRDWARGSERSTVAQTALATHEAASGLNHAWTKDSARVTADALDALGRTEEAKALRER